MKQSLLLSTLLLCVPVLLHSQAIQEISGVGNNYPTIAVPGTVNLFCYDYTNNLTKGWNVSNSTNDRLKLDYHINIENNYDWIKIYKGSVVSESALITRLTGSKKDNIYLEGGDITIVFTTDVSICGSTNARCHHSSMDINHGGFTINITKEDNTSITGTVTGNSTGGALRIKTNYGYLDLGPQNASYAHLFTDRNQFLFNKPVFLQDAKLSSEGASNLYLQTNATNRMAILNSNGYVGIGTTAPTALLDVNGGIKANSLSLTNTLSANGLTSTNGFFNSYNTNNLYLQTNGTNRVTVLNSNGYVGIGTASPSALLDISGNNPAFVLRGTPTRLQVGVPSANGNYAPYSKRGDVVFRPLSGVDGHLGLILNIPVDDADGKSYIKFGDDKNHGWFSLYNNKIAVINGRLGIGVENPVHALDVNGVVRAKEVKIETEWADFVFNDGYRLKPLSEVNSFIKENKHLPEIPSATEVKEGEGVNLGEMQVKLLQKIEELTLYLIQQENTIQELKDKIGKMENR